MTEQRILASSAVRAAGTVFSRASGYIRSALLVAALGASLRGDLFTMWSTRLVWKREHTTLGGGACESATS